LKAILRIDLSPFVDFSLLYQNISGDFYGKPSAFLCVYPQMERIDRFIFVWLKYWKGCPGLYQKQAARKDPNYTKMSHTLVDQANSEEDGE